MSDVAIEANEAVETDNAGARNRPRNELRVDRSASAVWFRNVFTIAKRELASYLNSPLAYIVIALSLVGFGFHFFMYKGGFWDVGRASTARLFEFVPIILCLITVPLFTMRALSEEKRVGTIELLITLPVRDSEVILGKFCGAFGMLTIQILLLAAYPLVMFWQPFHLGAFDWGPFWSATLGLLLMSGAGVGIGMMFSGFTESQFLSFFMTFITLGALFFIGDLVQYLPGAVGDFVAFFSFSTRYEAFGRGVIDTRSVVYFLSVTVITVLVAFRTLESRKWA